MTSVLAINGSPNMEKGNTHKILAPLLDGMRKAGASVDTLFSQKLKIRHCIGDFQCWFEKVGVCIHTDEMEQVYAKVREAEILVFATPIYLPLPGAFQNLLNRLMPLVEPMLSIQDGRTRAKWHDNVNVTKIVFVGSGGWYEVGNFEVVTHIVKEIAENVNVEFIGPIIRPHAGQLQQGDERTMEIYEAAEVAGRQLIEKGNISQELLAKISQPLITHEQAIEGGNRSYLAARDS
ncbi:MAG: flavodoxin family protein [Candidatus Thorarchaeota archaeon]